MKKKKVLFLPVLCLAVLLIGMTAFAASDGSNVKFCETCGTALITGASESGHWQTTHNVSTNFVDSNGKPIYEVCTITHVMTKVSKLCPNGHGVKWSGNCHDEYHSCSRCGHKQYYE